MYKQFLALSFILTVFALTISSLSSLAESANTTPTPVLIELFTSEGCSSCPPADRFLEELDSKQPIPGAQLIVLSEHVTYWNSEGWKDPFSLQDVTARQSEYGNQFKLASVYTPQMVVDGESQFTGSDIHAAQESVKKSISEPKIPVHITSMLDSPGKLKAHVEAGEGSGTVYVALALNHAESKVLHGENGGHRLTHVAVVQSLEQVGNLKKDKEFARDVEIKIPRDADPGNLRVVAFIQQSNGNTPGKVVGSALSSPTK